MDSGWHPSVMTDAVPPGPTRFQGVPSDVELGGRRSPDQNGFVTALAVRAFRQTGAPIPSKWLDLLESCRREGAGFAFWPVGLRPEWARDLPSDADDTAVMTLELMYAGRIDAHDAVQIAARTLGRQRISYLDEPGPPWRRRGVFSTWHRGGRGTDLIDCTVNANALALFASLGLLHLPGVAQSVEMLVAAIYWAGEHRSRATSLSPFYPECAEFVAALGNAVAAGVEDLEETYRVASAASLGRTEHYRS
jgi:hypothetical protein